MWTWKVRRWDDPPEPAGEPLPLACRRCGRDALCPTAGNPGSPVIAIIGMNIVFDRPGHVPPRNWMPNVIECRDCGVIYEDTDTPELQQARVAANVR